MRLLAVHPSGLMYTKIFLRLEPLGLEFVAAAARRGGHEVRADRPAGRGPGRYFTTARPLAARCGRFLVQLPRQRARGRRPRQGDQASAGPVLRLRRRPQRLLHGATSSSSTATARSTACCGRRRGRRRRSAARGGGARPGARLDSARRRHARRRGTAAGFVQSLDDLLPGPRPPAPSPQVLHRAARPVRLDRVLPRLPVGLPFCSAWTFYGRSYRTVDARAGRSRSSPASREPGIFIVDDVAFIQAEHGFAIGEAIAREASASSTTSRRAATCCCATRRSSSSGATIGLEYMFLGLEAIDEEGLKNYRKRVTLGTRISRRWNSPAARHRRGDQPHRRPGLGRGALP